MHGDVDRMRRGRQVRDSHDARKGFAVRRADGNCGGTGRERDGHRRERASRWIRQSRRTRAADDRLSARRNATRKPVGGDVQAAADKANAEFQTILDADLAARG